jgi:hypothetical protein
VISCKYAEDSKENEKFYHLVVHLNLARARSSHGFMRFFVCLMVYLHEIYLLK